jgi:hypothetical protein
MKGEKNRKQKKRKKDWLEITELFMAKKGKNGWDNCFWAVINRENDESGKEVAVSGHASIRDEGKIWSRDVSQDAYGENLDNMVELRLDYRLHEDPGISSVIADKRFFHN